MKERLYFGELENLSEEAVRSVTANQFYVEEETLKQYNFIIADIDHQDYEGSAYFLLEHQETGALFEVTGSHCSCMGFEDQWEPTPTTVEYLCSKHYSYGNKHSDMKLFMNKLFNKHLVQSILELN